ncbi:MAG: hypothetical protein VX246_01755 [Myxococcota bacterium]|nr:hypothetical protein [Myxococcota bacterium]
MSSHSRFSKQCGVCGCESLWIDEVAFQGRMLLAECPRCQHRWTEALPDPTHRTKARPARVVVAAAARSAGHAEAA